MSDFDHDSGESDDISDLLETRKVPGIKYERPKDECEGVVISWKRGTYTEFGKTDLATWPDGTPKEQLVVKLSTDYRDPDDEEDDGVRFDYVKNRALISWREAVIEAGGKTAWVPGTIYRRVFTHEAKSGKGFPEKMFTFEITPPARTARR